MSGTRRKNLAVLIPLLGAIAGMLVLVSYSVTLYRLFCEATGYGGATQRVAADTAHESSRLVTVSFDARVADGLPWKFEPLQQQVTLRLGEERLVFFYAKNLSDKPLVAHATFNVTPDKAGPYFNKIQCFCFSDERLAAGESVKMPVDFYVDPAMAKDSNASDLGAITLSYTFFPAAEPTDIQELSRFDPAAPPDAKRGAALFAERCSACHAIDRNMAGPMLGGVFGRPAGAVATYPYSDALKQSKLTWGIDTLDRWLANPHQFVPGSKMPIRVLDPNTRRDLIAYLKMQSGVTGHPVAAEARR
ncbi:MAG TPA: cytochrome c oxidase assembly protein [Pseudolabrys sp.]